MKLIIIRHGDPDYENDTLTVKGVREAKLLSDPYDPNFGVHAGDMLKVYANQPQNQPVYCYSDVSEKSLS